MVCVAHALKSVRPFGYSLVIVTVTAPFSNSHNKWDSVEGHKFWTFREFPLFYHSY